MNRFAPLFEPIKIGNLILKNRIAMAPMAVGGLLNVDGSPGPRVLDYYLERARGGVGLIITGAFRIENEVESFPGITARVAPEGLPAFTELAESLHSLGAKIFVQLTAGLGRVANPYRLQGRGPVSASPVPYYWDPRQTCRELKTEEVGQLVKAFGRAVEVLAAAGIDGVELHGHEGYLFDQFTTALWNKRKDGYGGTLENRLKLPIDVLREIKSKVGNNFHVQYRFGLKHFVKDLNSGALPGEKFVEVGRDIEEGLEIARRLEAAGFDSVHVDAGCYDSWYWAHPPVYQEPGFMAAMAAAVKGVVRIPVIAVGKMVDPEMAARMVAERKADIVALGKSLLADPYWVRKIEAQTAEAIRPCIGCHDGCMGRLAKGRPLSCAVNPATGRERSYRLEAAEKTKKVLVVGGGPAGLEAARVAALRGHKVTLFERSMSLGGHLIAASVPNFKKDLFTLLKWYEREIKKLDLNLNIRMGVEVDADLVCRENPGATIIATGSKPVIPDIPGLKERAVTALDLLLSRKKAGEMVLVVGGGLIGCETALWLARQGKKVTVIEILSEPLKAGIPVQHMNRLMLLDLLKFHKVAMLTNTSLLEFKDKEVLLTGGKERIPADTVVLAVGLEPEQGLYESLYGRVPNLYVIGDSRKAQNIMNSVWDGYEVGRMI